MGLALTDLTLDRWRNISHRELSLSPATTILAGPNATGKTNTLEALSLVTSGTGLRHARAREQVMMGEDTALVTGTLEGDGRLLDVMCSIAEGRRKFSRNGKAVRATDLAGTLLTVAFVPEDLDLVRRSAHYRRDELDAFGSQASPVYGKMLRSYARALEQRNRLLKDEHADPGLLEVWDEAVARGGAAVLYHRLRLFESLAPIVSEVYAGLSGGEELTLSYESSLAPAGFPLTTDLSKDDLQALLRDALFKSRAEDLRRGFTTVGPQRDDILFSLFGNPARSFASQGQQRTMVLAWKLAQVAYAEERLGIRPILLLDDVMSELDESRRAAVTRAVNRGIQTVITTTHLGYFTDEVLHEAEVIPYGPERA